MSHRARALPATVGVAAALLPTTGLLASEAASAATPTTTTKTYLGPAVEAERWGPLQVAIVVRTTTVKTGTKKKVTRKIVRITTPVYPDHTDRSIFINQEAIPILIQEALSAQSASIDMVSRATDTSEAFIESLQGALTKAKLGSSVSTTGTSS